MKRWLLAALVLASPLHAQSGTVAGRVVARETGEPLGYAIVSLPALSRDQFANDGGGFFFGALPEGMLALRVRRLGYVPVDTVIEVRPGTPEVEIRLSRVVTRLAEVIVRAHPPCVTTGLARIAADSTLRTIVEQVRLNAEQYALLVERHPFEYSMEIIESSRMKEDGHVRVETIYTQSVRPRGAWYKPGRVVSRSGRSHELNIPTLLDFATDQFLENHCFHFAGTTNDSVPLLRIDVVVADRIKDPDVNGYILLDRGSLQVRRTVLRLSRAPKAVRNLIDVEVTTEFREILPSIPVISSVRAVQTMAPNAKLKYDMSFEEQRLVGHRFLKGAPGEETTRRP